MKKNFLLLVFAGFLSCQTIEKESKILTSDIDNYWTAYDKIKTEKDSTKHLSILNSEFISKASIGQEKLFEVRNYTPEEYLKSMYTYPKFFTSLRENLKKRKKIKTEIQQGLQKFEDFYPEMKSGKVYFGVGNFRTGGTTVDSLVLFGSELVFTDKNIKLSEFKGDFHSFMKSYSQQNPIDDMVFLSIHEFVHTQQKEAIGTNLLTMSLREGSAEFIAEKLSKQSSITPAISFGKSNKIEIIDQFKKEMFNKRPSYWLWSSLENKFGNRDLGYWIGYDITEHHYNNSIDKDQALKDLVELDYSNVNTVKNFIDSIGYFKEPLTELEKAYNKNRPFVKEVTQKGDLFIAHFSEPMNVHSRGFDYGPLGEKGVLKIYDFIGFNEDATQVSFKANIQKDKKQQVLLTNRFMNKNGVEMKPYLLEIEN